MFVYRLCAVVFILHCSAFVTRGPSQGLTDPQVDSKCFSTTM